MSGTSQAADAPPPGKRIRLKSGDDNDSASKAAEPSASDSDAGDSANAKAIKSMLASIGERQSNWLYLVEDRLQDDGEGSSRAQASTGSGSGGNRPGQRVSDLRRTLRQYHRAPTETKRWSIMISRLSSRMDLQRNPFTHPADAARFNVGSWVDDPHNDEAITIVRTKTYTGTASSSSGLLSSSAPGAAESTDAGKHVAAATSDSGADTTSAAAATDNNATLAATLDAFDF